MKSGSVTLKEQLAPSIEPSTSFTTSGSSYEFLIDAFESIIWATKSKNEFYFSPPTPILFTNSLIYCFSLVYVDCDQNICSVEEAVESWLYSRMFLEFCL